MCPQRIFGLAIVVLVTLGGRVASYTNQWAVHIEGGPEVAQQVAQEHGFQYLDKFSRLVEMFLYGGPGSPKPVY
ncbi:furin-like [Frieseomelitta varia]|uniref:furin-like n=1 Tax=Frieseomelitta varia TaxID=561572 RepID=UPI001CB67E29|nr:furin-like [Frieseomelitta varia]